METLNELNKKYKAVLDSLKNDVDDDDVDSNDSDSTDSSSSGISLVIAATDSSDEDYKDD